MFAVSCAFIGSSTVKGRKWNPAKTARVPPSMGYNTISMLVTEHVDKTRVQQNEEKHPEEEAEEVDAADQEELQEQADAPPMVNKDHTLGHGECSVADGNAGLAVGPDDAQVDNHAQSSKELSIAAEATFRMRQRQAAIQQDNEGQSRYWRWFCYGVGVIMMYLVACWIAVWYEKTQRPPPPPPAPKPTSFFAAVFNRLFGA